MNKNLATMFLKIVICIIIIISFTKKTYADDKSIIPCVCGLGLILYGSIPFATASAIYYIDNSSYDWNMYLFKTFLGATAGSIIGLSAIYIYYLIKDDLNERGEMSDCQFTWAIIGCIFGSIIGGVITYKFTGPSKENSIFNAQQFSERIISINVPFRFNFR